jgi:hypothetical protein
MLQAPMILAAGSINAADATGWTQGCTVTDSGTGDKRVTLDQGADSTECSVLATIRGATSGTVRVVQTSDTQKDIKTFAVDGTTATDLAVDFWVVRKMGG